MKKLQAILLGIGLLTGFTSVYAQGDDYIVHTIKKGEIISVLAKKYGITPEDIARLNNFGVKRILHVGDKVKLPANATYREVPDSILYPKPAAPVTAVNPTQPAAKPVVNEVAVQPKQPTYVMHTVEKGEVFSVLSKKYNVPVGDILSLNKFSAGHILHVGDKIKLPATAVEQGNTTATVQQPVQPAQPVTQPVQQPTQPVVESKPAAEPPAGSITHIVKKKETLFGIAKQYKVSIAQVTRWNNLKGTTVAEGQKIIIYATPPPAQNDAVVQQAASQPVQQPVVKTEPVTKPAENNTAKLPAEQKTVTQQPAQPVSLANIPESGYFSSMFGKDVTGRTLQTANGVAMTFKTASGWEDKKYYILMNDVPPGSIVQVSNEDGKAVYAKVLWNMGDLKDNDGLTFRISDAAAKALNVKDSKFQLAVTFYE